MDATSTLGAMLGLLQRLGIVPPLWQGENTKTFGFEPLEAYLALAPFGDGLEQRPRGIAPTGQPIGQCHGREQAAKQV